MWPFRERARAQPPVLEREGECPVCEAKTRFVAREPWLRDHYVCSRCRSKPRERALMAVLADAYPGWRALRIHESSPGSPLSRKLAAKCRRYVGTQFFPGVERGRVHRGWRCEDLEALTFPDASCDLVITLDVMEHVLDPAAAFREIARTLAPGGAHVFTAPVYPGLARSEPRARRSGGEVEHLLPPEYHVNPVDPRGALVTIRYGADLPDLIARACGLATRVNRLHDPRRGIEGEFLDVMVTTKPRRE